MSNAVPPSHYVAQCQTFDLLVHSELNSRDAYALWLSHKRRSPILHPGNAVEVAQACVELGRGGGVHAWAVGAPGALMGIGCCCCIDVQAVTEQPFKHAASFACLYVQYQVSKLPAAQRSKGFLARHSTRCHYGVSMTY